MYTMRSVATASRHRGDDNDDDTVEHVAPVIKPRTVPSAAARYQEQLHLYQLQHQPHRQYVDPVGPDREQPADSSFSSYWDRKPSAKKVKNDAPARMDPSGQWECTTPANGGSESDRSPSASDPEDAKDDQTRSKNTADASFDDLDDNGKWGQISRKEIIIVSGLIVTILLSVTVAIVVMAVEQNSFSRNKNSDSGYGSGMASGAQMGSSSMFSQNSMFGPTAAPTKELSQDDAYFMLRSALEENPLTKPWTESYLPLDLDSLLTTQDASKAGDDDADDDAVKEQNAIVQAAIWAIKGVGINTDPLITRFALAHLYYSTKGPSEWTTKDGWLPQYESAPMQATLDDQAPAMYEAPAEKASPEAVSFCKDWYAVSCNLRTHQLEELDLADNNLYGTIPLSLSLMTSLRVLWLSNNALTGPIPGDAIASMSSLTILYLQNNDLTGPIPNNLHGNDILSKYVVD
jgi:Leucine rich repeat